MAKMSRGALKSLVKECLFEILLEASDESTGQPMLESRKRKSAAKRQQKSQNRPALDSVKFGAEQPKRSLDVSHITADPIMAAIFQDTASTTLVEQAAAEKGKLVAGGDAAALKASQSDPSSLFGEASKNWAALAFNGK